jgi:phosphoglycerate kinase
MEKELKALSSALNNPVRPFATIIGGAKVSSKMAVLENLLDKVEVMVVGGAMAFTFLKAQGISVGKSLVEDDRVDYCKNLIAKAIDRKVKLILPIDVVAAQEMKPGAACHVVVIDKIAGDEMGLDVGPATMKAINDALSPCKTILWNGPLGVFEMSGFEKGTYGLIDQLVALTKTGATTIIGGGDSVAAIEAKGVAFESFTHVSTGGGASLEGRVLPGVAALDDAQSLTSAAK